MPTRHQNKFLKILLFIFVYLIFYRLIKFLLSPSPIYNFVSDDFRVGDKYVLMYLVSKTAAFSDAEGADVFHRRRCGGRCFVTNNKGFLPVGVYDAVLLHGDGGVMSEAAAHMEPGKRYVLEAPTSCLNNKLLNCDAEPALTSFATGDSYDLCSLCRHLHKLLEKKSGFIANRPLTDPEKCA